MSHTHTPFFLSNLHLKYLISTHHQHETDLFSRFAPHPKQQQKCIFRRRRRHGPKMHNLLVEIFGGGGGGFGVTVA